MKEKSIRRTLYKVLRKTGVRREQIKPEASFNDDLRFDALDWTLFVYYLEGFFKINLNDREIAEFSQVQDTIDLLHERVCIEC
jgi:acyl carrier protein